MTGARLSSGGQQNRLSLLNGGGQGTGFRSTLGIQWFVGSGINGLQGFYLGEPLISRWNSDVPGQSDQRQAANDSINHIALPPLQPVSGGGWKRMVVVMPPFTKGQEGANQIIAALVLRCVRGIPEQVADGIDAPCGVMHQKNADKSAPQNGGGSRHPIPGDGQGDHPGKEESANDPQPVVPVEDAQLGFADQVWHQANIVLWSVTEHPAQVGMPPATENPGDPRAMMVRGVRIARFIAVSVVTTMAGSPEKDRPLSSHASGNAQSRPECIPAFKTAMSKKSVVSQRDTQHGQRIKARTKNEVQEGQSAIPKSHTGSDNGNPRNKDGGDRRNTLGALRRTDGRKAG